MPQTSALTPIQNAIIPAPFLSHRLFQILPLELREQIYAYILPPHLRSINPLPLPSHSPYHRNRNYAIFHVNRATRIDVGQFYLRSRPFEYIAERSRPYFIEFLDSFPDWLGYLSVRHLEFYKFWEEVPWRVGDGNMQLILRCAQLRTLTLWFNVSADAADAGSLFRLYQLGRMFALEHLAEIRLMWFFGWRGAGNSLMMEVENEDILRGLDFAEIMAGVEEMLRMGFEERGRRVEVRICPR